MLPGLLEEEITVLLHIENDQLESRQAQGAPKLMVSVLREPLILFLGKFQLNGAYTTIVCKNSRIW